MCYNTREVIILDKEELEVTAEDTQEQPPVYQPRPAWQVWAARIGLVLFLFVLIAYYINLFRGGR